MKYLKPDYYDKFQCLASACPDSCCKEWEIDIDPISAEFYRSLHTPLGDRLRHVLKDTEDGTVMTITHGRCPMWRPDGLCEIQAQLGHPALSKVCREFPRLTHDYGDFVELDLELSCPEAARLILTEPFSLTDNETDQTGVPDYDLPAMTILHNSRRTILAFLNHSTFSVPETLAVLLLYGYSVQSQLDGGEAAQLHPEADLQDAVRYVGQADYQSLLSFFRGLEILTPRWAALLKHPAENSVWDPVHLAFARCLIYRYWYQAVADYDLVSRVKFTVASCILVKNLKGDPIGLCQLFSKEIENDPDNVNAILDGTYTEPGLTDLNLLSLLLS